MKKRRKSLEPSSIRVYEHVVRKILLNNLSISIVFILSLKLLSAAVPMHGLFVIIDQKNSLKEVQKQIEQLGGQVRHLVPPRVVIADVPTSVSISSLKATLMTGQPIDINSLSSYGPLVMAAGIEWNRQLLNEAQNVGAKSFGQMKSLVGQRSLPPPEAISAMVENEKIHIQWRGVAGAHAYEIDAGFDSDFRRHWSGTLTNETSVLIPTPDQGETSLFIRVRSRDHVDGDHKLQDDLVGVWSAPIPLTLPSLVKSANPRQLELSSPQNQIKTEGTSVTLEWSEIQDRSYRVQLSLFDNFSTPVIDTISTLSEFVVPSQALHEGDKFYWRVGPWEKTGDWSPSRVFIVGPPQNTHGDTFLPEDAPQ